jgi:hypothetical protein
MIDLTESSLGKMLLDIAAMVENPEDERKLKPTQILIHPAAFKVARRIIFPHHILKRRKGARGRALTLKWRRK